MFFGRTCKRIKQIKKFFTFCEWCCFFVIFEVLERTNATKYHHMRNYLINLIEEKGQSLNSEIQIDGHFGITYKMLVDFICEAKSYHGQIRNTLVKIDFKNGDVFHYLDHLANGMVKSLGY